MMLAATLVHAASLSQLDERSMDTASHTRRLKKVWEGEPTWQERAIFVERYSPTTDTISFSPRTWPIDRHPWDEDPYKLAVLQRACSMTNDDPFSCYTTTTGTTPFRFEDSNTLIRKFDLYRARGRDNQYSYHCNKQLTSATYIGWPAKFMDADATDANCEWETNNPGYMQPLPDRTGPFDTAYDYTFEMCTYSGDCKPTDFDCINAYTVVALADPIAADAQNLFTYNIQADSTAAASRRLTEDYEDGEVSGDKETRKVTYYPRMGPPKGAKTVNVVYIENAEGPFFPCPVLASGQQVPCHDVAAAEKAAENDYDYDFMTDYEDPVTPEEQELIQARRLNSAPSVPPSTPPSEPPSTPPSEPPGAPPPGAPPSPPPPPLLPSYSPPTLVPTTDSVITVRSLKLTKIDSNEASSFAVSFSWTAEWSSRYATHPCTINLYDVGQGVSIKGKFVHRTAWWTPQPASEGATKTDVTYAPQLQVLHAPETPVMQPCSVANCPWPKQLFLRDEIKMTVTRPNTWNLNQFPFDSQTLAGSISLVDNVAYPEDRPRVKLNLTSALSSYDPKGDELSSLFDGSQWITQSVSLSQNAASHLVVDFTVEVQRSAREPIFKVMMPVLVNALLAILASRSDTETRITVIALSTLAAATMLNPPTLGLPEGLEGVPFVMSLVISHLGICFVILFLTGMVIEKQYSAGRKSDNYSKMRRPLLVDGWRDAFVVKKEVEQQLYAGQAKPNGGETGTPPYAAAPEYPSPPPSPSGGPMKEAEFSSTAPPDPAGRGLTGWKKFLNFRIGSHKIVAAQAPGREAIDRTVNDPISLLTKAILTLPPLFHHAVQSTMDKPTDPSGAGKISGDDWTLPVEAKTENKADFINHWMRVLTPWAYIVLWVTLALLYFV